MIKYNFRLDEQAHADILAMAKDVAGKPGNLTAGLCALIAEWRRLRAEAVARHERAAEIWRQEERLAAMDRRADAEGR